MRNLWGSSVLSQLPGAEPATAGRKKKRRVGRNEETGGSLVRQIHGSLVRTFAFSHKIKNDRIFSIEYKAPKNDGFVTVIRRKPGKAFEAVGGKVTLEVGTKLALSRHQVKILSNCMEEQTIPDLMKLTGRTDRTKSRNQVLRPLLGDGLIEMTIPDKPTSSKQKYRLTEAGKRYILANRKF
ncbi:MAG: Fic family protein [Desulfobulbaceae bacterium]